MVLPAQSKDRRIHCVRLYSGADTVQCTDTPVSGRFETWSDSPRPCFGGGGAWPGGGWSVPALVQRGGGRFWPLSSYTVHCTVYSTVPLYITVNGGEGRGGESIYIKA